MLHIILRGLSTLTLALPLILGVTSSTAHMTGETPIMCPVVPDEEVDSNISLKYEGQTVYFCCKKCRRNFETSPEKYVSSLVIPTDGGVLIKTIANTHAEHEHDYDDDDDDDDASEQGVLTILGRLHPAAVHFPIALLISAALVRCLMMMGSFPWAGAAVRMCVLLGGASAVVAVGLGWLNAGWPGDNESFGDVIFNHRWLGISSAVLGVILITMVEMEVRKPSNALRRMITSALILCAGLVGLTGYFGGIMVFGRDYLPW